MIPRIGSSSRCAMRRDAQDSESRPSIAVKLDCGGVLLGENSQAPLCDWPQIGLAPALSYRLIGLAVKFTFITTRDQPHASVSHEHRRQFLSWVNWKPQALRIQLSTVS